MNYENDRETEKSVTDAEGVMFAAQPVWERSRKRKGFGGRKAASAAPVATVVAPEPRTFAAERDYEEPMALERPVDPVPRADYARTEYAAMNPSPAIGSTPVFNAAADDDVALVAPIGRPITGSRSTRATKSSSVAPAAIAAAVVGLGALGAAGWYMTRDADGIPELAAGSTAPVAAPLTPVDPPAQVAVNEAMAPPAAAPAPIAPTASAAPPVQRQATARARPAAATSAEATGVNASTSATLPDGPQPYSSSTPSSEAVAPTQVNPPLVTLPPPAVTPAPAAAPVLPTPPLASDPATAPVPPPEATPPQ